MPERPPLVAGPHKCRCLCPSPAHKAPTPLIWAPGPQEHGCSDPGCKYAHGLERALGNEIVVGRSWREILEGGSPEAAALFGRASEVTDWTYGPWEPFGTHAGDEPVPRLEFSTDLGEDYLPEYERVVTRGPYSPEALSSHFEGVADYLREQGWAAWSRPERPAPGRSLGVRLGVWLGGLLARLALRPPLRSVTRALIRRKIRADLAKMPKHQRHYDPPRRAEADDDFWRDLEHRQERER